MASRADFEKINALIAEAVACCEAAQDRFDRLHEELRKSIDRGRFTARVALAEERARRDLFEARVKLSARRHIRDVRGM